MNKEEIVNALRKSQPEELEELLRQPIVVGLRAQGKLETVAQMLADGKTWDEIGKAIGWTSEAAERFWQMERDA